MADAERLVVHSTALVKRYSLVCTSLYMLVYKYQTLNIPVCTRGVVYHISSMLRPKPVLRLTNIKINFKIKIKKLNVEAISKLTSMHSKIFN